MFNVLRHFVNSHTVLEASLLLLVQPFAAANLETHQVRNVLVGLLLIQCASRVADSLRKDGVDAVSQYEASTYENLLLTLLVSVGALSERQLLLNLK